MTRKFITLALITAALAAPVAGFAGPMVNNAFGLTRSLDADSMLDLGLVTSSEAGVIEVYYQLDGVEGVLLGSTPVRAGVTENVRVFVNTIPSDDLTAVLRVGGQIVATQDYAVGPN